MITKKLSYEDFNGNQVTEECQFNLTKSELMKMELSEFDGMYATIEKMVNEQNTPKLVEYFDRFIIASYGKKSEDGKRFAKSPEMTEDFKNSLAYDELIVSLLSDPDEAVSFFQGIVPRELAAQIDSNVIEEAKAKANILSLGEVTAAAQERAENAANNDSESGTV